MNKVRQDDLAEDEIRKRLPDWLIPEIRRTNVGYIVMAQYALPPKFCLVCGITNPRLRRYGTRQQIIRDLPIANLWVVIYTTQQRFYCCECGGTFWESFSDVDQHKKMTMRLVKYIQDELGKKGIDDLAAQIGLDVKATRKLRPHRAPLRTNIEEDDDLFVY